MDVSVEKNDDIRKELSCQNSSPTFAKREVKSSSDTQNLDKSQRIKPTEIISAAGTVASAIFTLASVVTALMLTRQTRLMGRSLQVQEDNLKLLERQALSAEKQTRLVGTAMRPREVARV